MSPWLLNSRSLSLYFLMEKRGRTSKECDANPPRVNVGAPTISSHFSHRVAGQIKG